MNSPKANRACFADSAAALRQLLTDHGRDYAVYLERGPRQLEPFGRSLAYLWVVDAPDAWNLVDEWIVRYGYARAWTRDGRHVPAIVAAEAAARAGRAGCPWR